MPFRRTEAFLRARDLVVALGPAEIARRAERGTLTDLPGIGPSTAAVITQAVDGRVPDRIIELEATTAITPGEGAELLGRLRGDCHSHSTWSDGGASIAAMARTARDLGHEYLVVTDHSPRLTIAHGLNRDRLLAQLDEIDTLNEELAPFRILTGLEVDILLDGGLDHDDDLLARLDVVVASVHSKLKMPAREMTERMVRAIANPHVDILGHCTGRKVRGVEPDIEIVRSPSAFDAELVFAACARFDVAVEINCRPERRDPPPELLDLALDAGCRFSIDTDAHATGHLEFLAYGCDRAAEHGVAADRIVNTMPADELLAWTASHATT